MSTAPSPVILATAGYDHTIRLWDATSANCYRTIQYADSQVNCLAISPDKRYLAAAGNPHIRLFDINSQSQGPITSYDSHQGNVTSVGFQKDRKWMFTSSEDGSIKIWDLRAPSCQRNYENKGAVNAVVLHPNQGELISADENGVIRVWDLMSDTCTKELIPDGKTSLQSLSVASDASMLVAASNKGGIFAWKMGAKQSFDPVQKFEAHSSYVLQCRLSPDAKTLATCSADKTIKLWNVEKNFSLERTLRGHRRWVWDCSFSADSALLVSASSDQTAKLWDLKSGDILLEYAGHHSKAVTCVALNDNGE